MLQYLSNKKVYISVITIKKYTYIAKLYLKIRRYQIRESVFHREIQTPRRELKIRRAAEYFIFDESRCLESQ